MNTLDSPDFIEIVIKHLIRDRATFLKARDLKITADDFGDPITGIKVYREFVSIVLEVNNSPISYDVFRNAVGTRMEEGKLANIKLDEMLDFIVTIYDGELSSDYVTANLAEFIKRRRGVKLKMEHKDDLDTLAREYSKLVEDLRIADASEFVQVINPFEAIHRRSIVDFIPTGLTRIDAVIQGLGVQELALIMAATGGGKTTMATVLAKNAATAGKKVLYLSLEEPAVNVTQRFYANVLDLAYGNLYRGLVEPTTLDQHLNNLDPDLRHALTENLRIVDLRDLTPLSPATLVEWLVKYCADNDYWPDLLFLDQLEFMKSDTPFKSQWEMYQDILLCLFKLTSGLLAGHKALSMYVLHQLTDMRLNYTLKEIAGFKGAARKCDLVIVIGRKGPLDPLMNLHSLKARHSRGFELKYNGVFEKMDIQDTLPADSGRQRILSFTDSPTTAPVVPASLTRPAVVVEQLPPPPVNPS